MSGGATFVILPLMMISCSSIHRFQNMCLSCCGKSPPFPENKYHILCDAPLFQRSPLHILFSAPSFFSP
ncbi:unnamed protein product [Prunus brigantina]